MKSKTAAVLCACFAFGTIMPGCFVAAVGAVAAAGYGAYKYAKGELKTVENVPLEKGWNAALAGIKELEFRITDEAKDAVGARLTAVMSDKTEVKIHLEYVDKDSTSFSVRVGTLGDEPMSRRVMDTIKKHF